MAKNYLVIKDNVIEKYLLLKTKEIAQNSFYFASIEISEIIKEVVIFYAEQFTNNDENLARELISGKEDNMTKEDTAQTYFCLGNIVIMTPVIVFLLFSKNPSNFNPDVDPDIGNWMNIDYIF